MDDREIMTRINKLVDQEHALLEQGESDGLDDNGREQLQTLEVEVDRLWDLIRQRRALRRAGLNPDAARLRSAATVERYQQ